MRIEKERGKENQKTNEGNNREATNIKHFRMAKLRLRLIRMNTTLYWHPDWCVPRFHTRFLSRRHISNSFSQNLFQIFLPGMYHFQS